MTARLVALDEGPDIVLDRAMVVVGRHPACDARLDSLRVSRHHCCMMQESGDVVVRDLGSTNGIRINGQRVEMGRLRPGDELSIAHIRYRLDNGQAHDQTLAEPGDPFPLPPGGLPGGLPGSAPRPNHLGPKIDGFPPDQPPLGPFPADEKAMAAAVRRMLPSALADKYQIKVIVQLPEEKPINGAVPLPAPELRASENVAE